MYSNRVVNARSVFQEHHLVMKCFLLLVILVVMHVVPCVEQSTYQAHVALVQMSGQIVD